MPMTPHEAGDKLASYLRRAGKQQKDLAAEIGVEPSYISRMVKGHINWTTGQYFGQIASSLRLKDDEVKELNLAAVVEVVGPDGAPAPAQQSQAAEEEIPAALLEAAQMYASIDPLIGQRDVQLSLARAGYFGGGPETPQDWIRYFNDVRNWIGKARS